MTAAEIFAEWALALTLDDVPAEARRAAKRHLFDGLGCAVAADRMGGVATHARITAQSLGAADEATVIGTGKRLSAPAAALANGALVHALDFDDTHAGALVHATAAVLPAAFAVGEQTGATGADVLTAAIAGYETVIRLGAVVPHGFHARGLHATSVCGVFASALISARLMGLDAHATVDALGIAGSMASGSLEFLNTGSSTKQLHPGMSGMAGIIAARLAQAGADGPASILEGEHGLYRALANTEVSADAITDGLGDRWDVTRITIKPYPLCQLSHASLDALRTLLPKLGDPHRIDSIVFAVPEDAVPIVCEPASEKHNPRSEYEAKFSLQYCAALMIANGGLDITTSFWDRSPKVLALAGRVGYKAVPFTPAAQAPGDVEVTREDGERLHASVPQSRGGPEAPLSDDEICAKFGAEPEWKLAQLALAMEDLPSLAPILEATR
jgi:2-methylcitrate dehydratase PrpD